MALDDESLHRLLVGRQRRKPMVQRAMPLAQPHIRAGLDRLATGADAPA